MISVIDSIWSATRCGMQWVVVDILLVVVRTLKVRLLFWGLLLNGPRGTGDVVWLLVRRKDREWET